MSNSTISMHANRVVTSITKFDTNNDGNISQKEMRALADKDLSKAGYSEKKDILSARFFIDNPQLMRAADKTRSNQHTDGRMNVNSFRDIADRPETYTKGMQSESKKAISFDDLYASKGSISQPSRNSASALEKLLNDIMGRLKETMSSFSR